MRSTALSWHRLIRCVA